MKVELFRVEWDYSKTRIQPSDERYKHREVSGIRWSNGVITLENGAVYSNLNEMEYTIKKGGKYRIVWTHDVEGTERLLHEATALITNCQGIVDDVYKGTAMYEFHVKPLRQWLERAEKASGIDGEETAQGGHQLL